MVPLLMKIWINRLQGTLTRKVIAFYLEKLLKRRLKCTSI